MAVEVESNLDTGTASVPLESRPGIFLIGSSNVGKRTILSRLLSIDLDDDLDTSTGVLCQGWKIDTKYYSADVSIWSAQLDEDFSFRTLPVVGKLAALVLVFDLNDLSTFAALQNWVSGIDLKTFEILLCIGNKADLLPGHSAHVEYRRRIQKRGESSSHPHSEFSDYGIYESEGTSLLGNEEPPEEIQKSCLNWCVQHGIEYVEACASNADFDKCLSVHGDIQGVDRLYVALTSHMWPGMVLKSGNVIAEPFPVEKEEESEDESEYELEYEVLSGGFDDPWDENISWVAFNDEHATTSVVERTSLDVHTSSVASNETKFQASTSCSSTGIPGNKIEEEAPKLGKDGQTSEETSNIRVDAQISDETFGVRENNQVSEETLKSKEEGQTSKETYSGQESSADVLPQTDDLCQEMHMNYDDLEHLMSEIGNMRDNIRLMPDFQRRDVAAKLAMKMAAMFAYDSEDEGAS